MQPGLPWGLGAGGVMGGAGFAQVRIASHVAEPNRNIPWALPMAWCFESRIRPSAPPAHPPVWSGQGDEGGWPFRQSKAPRCRDVSPSMVSGRGARWDDGPDAQVPLPAVARGPVAGEVQLVSSHPARTRDLLPSARANAVGNLPCREGSAFLRAERHAQAGRDPPRSSIGGCRRGS